jgi:hypothetical protein
MRQRQLSRGDRAPAVAPARKAAPDRRRSGDATLERQAEEAAARALRGEVGVARALSRAPAAHVELPGSPGAPLPDTVRADAERAFGAELGAVRVHRDPDANAAASRAGARAFTAGRDVFLAEAEWRPSTPSGRALVYHELAHVLQQTSAPGPGGRARATERSGDGPPQVRRRR